MNLFQLRSFIKNIEWGLWNESDKLQRREFFRPVVFESSTTRLSSKKLLSEARFTRLLACEACSLAASADAYA